MNDADLEARLRQRPRPALPVQLRQQVLAAARRPMRPDWSLTLWPAAAAILLCCLLGSYDRRAPAAGSAAAIDQAAVDQVLAAMPGGMDAAAIERRLHLQQLIMR